jgi:hypothetical protein
MNLIISKLWNNNPHYETMMSKPTSPRDLGVHTEEVEDHPFLELVQYYHTVQMKKQLLT